MTISLQILVIGFLSGLAYAVLGTGLVLIYRATRVINFAHGQMGAFGAGVLAILVLEYGWNWFLAFLLVVVIGGSLGAAIELTVIRRLFNRSRLILLVATAGVAQLLFFAEISLPDVSQVVRYPTGLQRQMDLGGFLLSGEHFMVLAVVPALIVGLAMFMQMTPYGMAIRAASDNADAARLAGVSVKSLSTVVWIIAGVLATVTFVLISPLRGEMVGTATLALGPGLLLRALAAGLFGRMYSLPLTLLGGVVIGVIESVLFASIGNPGTVDALIFVGLLVLIGLRGRDLAAGDSGEGSLVPRAKPVPARLREVAWVRRLPHITAGVALVVAIVLPLLLPSSGDRFMLTRILVFAVIGLSITVLTGWAGQLSLGQFAFVGLGAMMCFALVDRGMPFGAAVVYASAAGAVAALLVGAPALRIRGMALAVATLGFAVAAQGYFLQHPVLTGGDRSIFLPRQTVLGIDLSSHLNYYYFSLAIMMVAAAVVTRLRRSGIGRTIVAVRDNADSAAAMTVSPTVARLTAFAFSGLLAALGGALYAGLYVQFSSRAFSPDMSVMIVAMTIIGGLESAAGAMLGALYVMGLPALIGDSQQVRLLTSGAGLLILLMYLPGGLLQVVHKVRDVLLSWAERRLGDTPTGSGAPPATAAPVPARPASLVAVAANGDRGPDADLDPSAPALRTRDVSVHFGGLTALENVSITVHQREIVGLIGSNGAGKSTLMNVIGGLERASGRVEALGWDVTDLAPHERARVGTGRVFQDARLYGDLTVSECVQVALEARERSELLPSALSLPPSVHSERRKQREAEELVNFVGLTRYADSFANNLSTGTRRIAELACLLALQARLLLLDEPTAGVAQRETEAFGPLIQRIQKELDATVLIIEHDMPLVMSLSDRIYCLGAGKVIAEGQPEQVRDNPSVIASYLGTDERAIARSGTTVGGAPPNGHGETGELRQCTRQELLDLARAQGMTGVSRLRKHELVELLESRV